MEEHSLLLETNPIVEQAAAVRRTFAIISHPDAGKTTLTEKLLLYGNAIDLAGNVRARRNQRSTTSDWMAMERERGISITSTVLQFPYKDFVINLLDTPDAIRAKIMRATTDSLKEIRFDESRPGIYNLLTIYQSFTGQKKQALEEQFEGKGYGDFKKALAEVVVEGLRPLQERYRELTAAPGRIDAILAEGAAKARPLAEKTLAKVHKVVGLG